jgi:hypothetical protein
MRLRSCLLRRNGVNLTVSGRSPPLGLPLATRDRAGRGSGVVSQPRTPAPPPWNLEHVRSPTAPNSRVIARGIAQGYASSLFPSVSSRGPDTDPCVGCTGSSQPPDKDGLVRSCKGDMAPK